jgi:hypothetical protein
VIRRGNIYVLVIKNIQTNKQLYFKCSYRFLPLKLSDIAKKFDLPDKLELDHGTITEKNFLDPEIKKKVQAYCSQDALILHKALLKLNVSLKEVLPYW